jgi:hypothetical protein
LCCEAEKGLARRHRGTGGGQDTGEVLNRREGREGRAVRQKDFDGMNGMSRIFGKRLWGKGGIKITIKGHAIRWHTTFSSSFAGRQRHSRCISIFIRVFFLHRWTRRLWGRGLRGREKDEPRRTRRSRRVKGAVRQKVLTGWTG